MFPADYIILDCENSMFMLPLQCEGSERQEEVLWCDDYLMPDSRTIEPNALTNTRRSLRVAARIQVQVRKQVDGDAFITEVSHTLVVNAQGALIHLALKVQLNDILLIKHLFTQEERRSRVVSIGKDSSHQNQVAIEFTVPAPHFWHIDFPPADWKPSQDSKL